MAADNGVEPTPEEVKPRDSKKAKEKKVAPPANVDLVHRDPNDINPHLRLEFSDVIGEPEPGTFSDDAIWIHSNQLFSTSKLWCYRILTIVCAIPAAICWGVCFACLSFTSIWCYGPCRRGCHIQMHCIRHFYSILIDTIFAPLADAAGRVFSHIRIGQYKTTEKRGRPEGRDSDDDLDIRVA